MAELNAAQFSLEPDNVLNMCEYIVIFYLYISSYCRRVLPEGATTCLPLCYCLIGKYRAPGFYYKVSYFKINTNILNFILC